MHVGMVMECDYREGRTQEEAFAEALSIADLAESSGIDGVWLAERHFAGPRRPTDPMGAGIPSIASVPLVLAAAIAGRTTRLRIATGVSVLPLCHPIRTAEEAATVDQVSRGRLDFGVGRSGFPRAYAGYGIPYEESRDRFQESLEVILKAWTQERFSHAGKFFTFKDLAVVPRPYQKPHPPIWVAATTQDTFPSSAPWASHSSRACGASTSRRSSGRSPRTARRGGRLGIPAMAACTCASPCMWRTPRPRLARSLRTARCGPIAAWPKISPRRSERRGRLPARSGPGGQKPSPQVTYDELLQDRVAYGTPDMVVERLRQLKDDLGLSGVVVEPNVGGRIPAEGMLRSIRLYAQEVGPRLHGDEFARLPR